MSSLNSNNFQINTSKGAGEEVQVQEQVTNVFFAEEREVSSSKVFASEPTFSSSYVDSVNMPEQKWLLSEILTRPVQLPTVEWSTATAAKNIIASFDIPRSIYNLSIVPISVLLSFMSFLRADWTLRLQLNSPKFSQGRLLVYFDPLNNRPFASGGSSNNCMSFYNLMVLPHVWLDPSDSKVVELVIPYRHFLDYFRLNYSSVNTQDPRENSLGRVHFIVFNPLEVSTGTTTSVYVTPSIYAQNPSVHVPTAQHDLETPLFSVRECGLTDVIGAATDTFKAGAAIASGSPTMVSSTLKAVGSVAKVLQDLDRPLSVGEVILPCNRMLAPFSHGSGVDSSIRLSLLEGSQTQTPSEIAGDAHKESDLSPILKIPTVITIQDWSSTQGSDTPLFLLPVTPNYHIQEAYSSTTYIGSFSNLGAWASRFKYWRGGIRFIFDFVSTQFHAGRLRASFFPNQFFGLLADAPSSAAGTSVPNMIMDLQAKKEFEFVVPWYSGTPYRKCTHPYDATQEINQHFRSNNYGVSGTVVIYVLNPLIVNNNAPAAIHINVLMSGADDFELFGPCPPQPELVNPVLSSINPLTDENLEEVFECGLTQVPGDVIEGEDMILKPVANILSHGSGIVKSPSMYQAGESHMNIKNLIRRFGFHSRFGLPDPMVVAPACVRIRIPQNPTLTFNVNSNTDNRPLNLFSFINSLFAMWRGSIRYKLISPVSKNAQLLVYSYHNLLGSSTAIINGVIQFPFFAFSYGSAVNNFSHTPAFELEAPFVSGFTNLVTYNPKGLLSTRFYSVSSLDIICSSTADSVFPVVAGSYIDCFVGAGDDFVLHYYLGPLIYVCSGLNFPIV